MNVELPSLEYDGDSILEDVENFDIPLEFDITKVRISSKKEDLKRLKLKDFLVYIPFLLYISPNSTEVGLFFNIFKLFFLRKIQSYYVMQILNCVV